MAITKIDGSATISTTEFFLASNSTTQTPQTTACVMQPWIDTANLAAGDQYRVRIYEKINGGTQRVACESFLTGAQQYPPVYPALIVTDGWEVSLLKIAGTDRTLNWSIRKAG